MKWQSWNINRVILEKRGGVTNFFWNLSSTIILNISMHKSKSFSVQLKKLKVEKISSLQHQQRNNWKVIYIVVNYLWQTHRLLLKFVATSIYFPLNLEVWEEFYLQKCSRVLQSLYGPAIYQQELLSHFKLIGSTADSLFFCLLLTLSQ